MIPPSYPPPDPAPGSAIEPGAPVAPPRERWWHGLTWWEALLYAAGLGIVLWRIVCSLANLE